MNVLVTGGTRGIGKEIAIALQKDGHKVTVTGTRSNGKAPQKCAYWACDFANTDEVNFLAKKLSGGIWDTLVNCAGVNKIGPVENYDFLDFERIQKVNVMAPFLLCRAVVPGMKKRGFGRILNITSIFGVVSRAGRSAYSTSKFGLFGLTRALALEVAKHNILVNCLAPGFIETDMTRQILGPKGMKDMVKKIPMGRMAQPKEIAAWAKFLVSKENTYMTGQNIVVDGGYTCE